MTPQDRVETDRRPEERGITRRENLTLLGRLPLEPEVVRQGDAGNVSGLHSDRLAFNKAFNGLVDREITSTRETADTVVLYKRSGRESVSEAPPFLWPSKGERIVCWVADNEKSHPRHF